jgi:hypothetical protein
MRALTTLRTSAATSSRLRRCGTSTSHAVDELEKRGRRVALRRGEQGVRRVLPRPTPSSRWSSASTRSRRSRCEKASELASLRRGARQLVNEGLTCSPRSSRRSQIDDATARTRILEGRSARSSRSQNRARATWQARRKELASPRGAPSSRRSSGSSGRGAPRARALRHAGEVRRAADAAAPPARGARGQVRRVRRVHGRARAEARGGQRRDRREAPAARSTSGSAARRTCDGGRAHPRRASSAARSTFKDADELNAYFASDAMVLKLRDIAKQLLDLGDTVQGRRARSRDSRPRGRTRSAVLRDRLDLFEGGDAVIGSGRHRFSVNTQPLELTIVPREGGHGRPHLTGTDFYEPIEDDELEASRHLWDQQLVRNERGLPRRVPRGVVLFDAEAHRKG